MLYLMLSKVKNFISMNYASTQKIENLNKIYNSLIDNSQF